MGTLGSTAGAMTSGNSPAPGRLRWIEGFSLLPRIPNGIIASLVTRSLPSAPSRRVTCVLQCPIPLTL